MLPQDGPAHTNVSRRRDLTLPGGFIAPCFPMMAPRPPSGSHWLHEVRLRGTRIIARKDCAGVMLYDRLGNDSTRQFPLIVEAMSRLPRCTIDGVVSNCGDDDAHASDRPAHCASDEGMCLYAVDLIELSGDDRRRDPLEWRKLDLHRLLAEGEPRLLLNGYVDGEDFSGAAVLEGARSLGFEGVVSKRKDSRYLSGLSPYWLETNNSAVESLTA
jgi:bifunctional non-homologous end joining protein LigD